MIQNFIIAQIGAREHYIIARELHRRGQLHQLITDAWVPPGSWPHHIPGGALQRLYDRFHPDLEDAPVQGFTAGLVGFEAKARLSG